MSLTPVSTRVYHVFLASPGDVDSERQHVRRFFENYNRHTAHLWKAEFRVVDWENYATIGVGRPQQLVNQTTLEKFRDSLALVIGIMGQRFGSPTGVSESGTEEEFLWAKRSHDERGSPEIKWFFRRMDKLEVPTDPDEAISALEQWRKVLNFRDQMRDLSNPIFYTEYSDPEEFVRILERDLSAWLSDSARPWAEDITSSAAPSHGAPPLNFDSEAYRTALLNRFDKLNYEMLDSTGAYYSGVRLWSVFVPQSVRECHQYNPRLLEIPKEHQQRLLRTGEIDVAELQDSQQQAEILRRDYFQQPLRSSLETIDEALLASSSKQHRLTVLGDPGSGKSSLIRYLALRWCSIADQGIRGSQAIPLVIELGSYSRWECGGLKSFVRYLEEAPLWHAWPTGLLGDLLSEPGRIVLFLDGLDEVFDPKIREDVINDIQRFSTEFASVPVLVTSRVVGYQWQRLRDANFKHFILQDLDAHQVGDFIDRWHNETFDNPEQAGPKRDRLKKAISDSKSIAMLAGNPLLLTMMAILNRSQELPRDRVDLYAQSTRLLLHQWDTERALADFPGLSADIGWREKHDLLQKVAATMHAAPSGLKGNMIDGETLTGLVENYLRVDLHFSQSKAAARAVVDHLRQRNFVLCFVGADSYGFVHRTFLEYFCAADFVRQFNVAKTIDEPALLALVDQHCRNDDWREVLRLICSQIDEQFVGRIITRIAKRVRVGEDNGSMPELALAVRILNDARNLPKLATPSRELLQSIIDYFSTIDDANPDALLFIVTELMPVINEVGGKWPDKAPLEGAVLSQIPKISMLGLYFWPQLVAKLLDDSASLRKMAFTDDSLNQNSAMVRRMAIETLANCWPDASREFISNRAADESDDFVRGATYAALAAISRTDETFRLLCERLVDDSDPQARSAAITAVANLLPGNRISNLFSSSFKTASRNGAEAADSEPFDEEVANATLRTLLEKRAVEDKHSFPRGSALEALATRWPDSDTRRLLAARAVEDPDPFPRTSALKGLQAHWADATSREFFETRALQETATQPACAALRALASEWPDGETVAILRTRALNEEDSSIRVEAAGLLARINSRFGAVLMSRDFDGVRPFIEPREPVSNERISRAASAARVAESEVPAVVSALNEYLGWDVTVGINTTAHQK